MFKVIGLAIALFTTIIFFKCIYNQECIKKAIQKFVKPKLDTTGFVFERYKWLGFFNHGDFKDDEFVLVPASTTGKSVISNYVDVYYSKASVEKKVTVRIDSTFLAIWKVAYSSEF